MWRAVCVCRASPIKWIICLSAFINNTAVVAIFMPIVLGLARQLKVSASKLLMPMSFASMFGGVCTLIGTSTNIIVSGIASMGGETRQGAVLVDCPWVVSEVA